MSEKINHPSHYGGDTTYEAIKVIEAWQLGFCLGNAVKYICRAGKKDEANALDDLRKARWYLDREIMRRENTVALRDFDAPVRPFEGKRVRVRAGRSYAGMAGTVVSEIDGNWTVRFDDVRYGTVHYTPQDLEPASSDG